MPPKFITAPIVALAFTIISTVPSNSTQPPPKSLEDTKELLLGITSSFEQLPLTVQRTLVEVHYKNIENRHGRVLREIRADRGLHSLDDIKSTLRAGEIHFQHARNNLQFTKFSQKVVKRTAPLFSLIPTKTPLTALTANAASKLADPAMEASVALAEWSVDFGASKAFTLSTTEEHVRQFAKIAIFNNDGSVDANKLKKATSYFDKTFVNNPAFSKLDDTQKARIAWAMQARLEKALDKQGEDIRSLLNGMSKVEGDTATAIKYLLNTESLLNDAAKFQQKFATDIASSQSAINRSLVELHRGIQETDKDVKLTKSLVLENTAKLDAVMSAMYDDLPTQKKIEWLNQGNHPSLSGNKVAEEKLRQEKQLILENRIRLTGKVTEYLNGGSEVLGIAQKLGFPPAAVEKANKALERAQTANGAIQNVLTGNYFTAAGSVAKLIFGSSPDAATVRHQQLMAQFGVVNEKLDTLIKGQQAIYGAILAVDEKVTQLGKVVIQQHDELMLKLGSIEELTLSQNEVLKQLVQKELDQCKNFLKHLPIGEGYHELEVYFREQIDGFKAGEEVIRTWMTDIEPTSGDNWAQLNRWFFVSTHLGIRQEGEPKEHYSRLKSRLSSLVSILNLTYPESSKNRAAWSLLALPSAGQNEVRMKVSLISGEQLEPLPLPYDAITELLHPEAVIEFSRLMLEFSNWTFLVNRSATVRLYSAEELSSVATFDKVEIITRKRQAKRVAHFCLALVNATIAQQQLLSGDILLPVIAERRLEKDVAELLRGDPLLTHNVYSWEIRNRINKNGHNSFSYSVALNSIDSAYLTLLVATNAEQWRFEKSNKPLHGDIPIPEPRWIAHVHDGIAVEMPEPGDIAHGRLLRKAGIERLESIREQILARLAELDLHDTTPSDVLSKLGLISFTTN